MTKSLFTLAIAIALPVTACVDDSTDLGRQRSASECSNTSTDPCGCDTNDDCPTGTICQVTDATPPPWAGICIPEPACDSNTDPDCAPPPPPSGCNNTTDPDCDNTPPPPPPGDCSNTTDPDCNAP
jgi:hypothetical protein